MLVLLLPLIALLVFAQPASVPRQEPPSETELRQSTRFTAEQRAQCAARGGRVATAGLSGEDMCAELYRDAGRRCSDGSQCMGDCLLDEASLNGKRPVHDMEAAGLCQAFAYPFGCRNLIEDGRLTLGLCVD